MEYIETSKPYKVYVATLKKTVIRRDVKFEEERALKNSLECEQATAQEK